MRKYEAMPGDMIGSAIAEIVRLANLHNEPVSMDFNGVTVVAQPGANASELQVQWSSDMERRTQEYRGSNAAKRAASAARVRLSAMQRVADALMQRFEALDYSNLDELIQFFDDLTDPSDYIGVKFDRQHIVDTLTRHGFIIGANTGTEFDVNNRENFARYLIGQAMGNLISVGAVHHMYHRMAQEWRDKFATAGKSC